MTFGDWRTEVILSKLTNGCTLIESASAAGISRQAVWKRMLVSPAFAQAVSEAREAGSEERRYRSWLSNRNRGKRGVWWKPGVVPAFRYGRR
jgi:hypothetical protein